MFRYRIFFPFQGVISLYDQMSSLRGLRTSSLRLVACCRLDAKIIMRIMRRLSNGLVSGLVSANIFFIHVPMIFLLCITLL